MLFEEYITNIGGISKMCDIYLTKIKKEKFMKNFQSNKDLIFHSFKKLNASSDFLNKIKKLKTYEEIKDVLVKVKGGELKWK